jgi:hypothetical protein
MKQEGIYKNFSKEKDCIYLETGIENKESQFGVTKPVKDFMCKGVLKVNDKVIFSLDKDNKKLSFIQKLTNKTIVNNEKLQGGENGVNRRSALKQATNLVIAKNGKRFSEKKVLEIANQFLNFLNSEED